MKTSTQQRPDANEVLRFCHDSLGRANLRAIEECARRDYGANRCLTGIVSVAQELGADVRVAVAAFGFLPNSLNPDQFVDTFTDTEETASLPDDIRVVAAYALARLVLAGAPTCPIAYTPR